MSKYTIEHKNLEIDVWEKSINVRLKDTTIFTNNLYFNPKNREDIINFVEQLINLGKTIKLMEIKKMLEIHN